MRHQQELLEKPGGVRAMPFRRTGVRHRLHDLILRAERGRTALGLAPDGEIGFHQILGQRGGIGEK